VSKPFISIIIPIFNKQDYIEQSIESLVNQTYLYIEIICVDDCSTDKSLIIVEGYAKKDNRVKIIKHDRNMGTLKSRSTGVASAKGRFIMFLDADDELEINACEKLYNIANEHQAEIYAFGTKVICDDRQIANITQNHLRMPDIFLNGKDIILKSFVDQLIPCNIWGKLFCSKLCKNVYALIGNDHLNLKVNPLTEDFYAYMVLTYFANSFYSTGDVMHRYHYGRGVTGSGYISLERFEKYCISAVDAENFRKFFLAQGKLEEYTAIIEMFSKKILGMCCKAWNGQIEKTNKAEALQILIHYWPQNDIFEWLVVLWDEMSKLSVHKKWEIPFSLLPKGCNIILYGAGEMGKDFYRQITNSGICNITLWVDKEYNFHQNIGLPVCSPNEINNVKYDCILIAVSDFEIANIISRFLIETLNVPNELIIWNDPYIVNDN